MIINLDINAKHKLIGIKNIEISIHRFFEVSKLFGIFETKSLGLVQPKCWEDPYEQIFSNSLGVDAKEKKLHYSLEGYTKNIYGQCWTLNDEDDSAWRIYSPNADKVRVKTTINKLFKNVKKINDNYFESYIGKVKYIKEDTLRKNIKRAIRKKIETFEKVDFIKEFYLKKRDSFKYENELRILTKVPDLKENGFYKRIVFFNETPILEIPILNPNDFIEEIIFDPRMPENIVNAFTLYLKKKYKYKNRTSKSKLYARPEINVEVIHKFDKIING